MNKHFYLAVVSALAAAYLVWFLSFPVFAGLQGADGAAVYRWQFLTRVLLPELWWGELTGGGKMPLGLLDRLPIALGVVAWCGAAFVIGRPLVRMAFASLTRIEFAMLSALAGLAMLSAVTLVVGLAGGSSSRWAILIPVITMVAAQWFANLRVSNGAELIRAKWLPDGVEATGVFGQLASRLVVVLTIVLAIVYSLGAMMPPYEFDVVEYHLQSAKEFFQNSSIGFNDHNIYINMPLGLEMHALAAMSITGGADGWWLGGLIGKAIVGAHALIAAGLLGGFVARKTDSQWLGWCAAGLWLAVPGNAHVSMTGLIDAAMGTYIAAAAIGLTELAGKKQEHSAWLVLLISVCAGAAAATKYTGLMYAVLPCVVAVIAIGWQRLGPKWFGTMLKQWSGPFAIGLLLTCIPWYAKNSVQTGNPFYPLAYEWLGGAGLNAERAAQWSQAHRVPIEAGSGSAYSVAALLKSAKQVLIASEFVQPSLVILWLCGWIGAWKLGGEKKLHEKLAAIEVWAWGAGSLWILAVWWLATHRIDRFWLPAVSLCLPVAGVGMLWVARHVSHALATVLVLIGLGFGLLVGSSPVVGDTRFFVSLAALRADNGNADELKESGGGEEVPGRLSRSIGWCNDNLDSKSTKLLLVGEGRAFDFRMPIVYSTCFDVSPAETWLRVGASGESRLEEQRGNLRAAGITHVLFNWSELSRYRSPGNYGFSDWPTRAYVDELAASGLLKRVEWPIESEFVELFTVEYD